MILVILLQELKVLKKANQIDLFSMNDRRPHPDLEKWGTTGP